MTISHIVTGVINWDKTIFVKRFPKEGGDVISIPTIDLVERGLKKVNTVGAGDAFIGTFCAMKILGKDDLESIFLANMSGELKVTKEGTRGSPTIDELTEFRNSLKNIEYPKLL